MTSKLEYAALSAIVYNDQRGGGNGSPINRVGLPPGWQSLSDIGFAAGDNLNSNPFSFTGGAYLNQATGEIVIAYKGTDFLTGFEGRSFNTVADLVTDVSLAISRKGLGTYNLQQLAASSYFLAVKDWAAQNGYDGNKISFTGHSLGGGLASNIAVWFDRPATTFAEAPFELSAVNPLAVTAAAATLTLQAGVTASAAVLEEITKLTDIAKPGVYEARQNAVTNYYNKGDFLGCLSIKYASSRRRMSARSYRNSSVLMQTRSHGAWPGKRTPSQSRKAIAPGACAHSHQSKDHA